MRSSTLTTGNRPVVTWSPLASRMFVNRSSVSAG